MIISVPEYKKINKYNKRNISTLNESMFDDFDDDFDDILGDDDYVSTNISSEYEENELKPRVERMLNELDVDNYEIKCTGHGILVDVHDNLYLSNKGLNRMGMQLFKFNEVDGSCNMTGNNLSDWTVFPYIIHGNCYANFNNIKTFDGAPKVLGKMIANKQNKKPKYPLTNDNYLKFKSNQLHENDVYVIKNNKFGILYSIQENVNTCIVKFNDNTKQKFNLNEVEYLGNIENLII